MEFSNWILTVEFDSLHMQELRDPEYTFPHDECSRCVRQLGILWDLIPEELKEIAEWDSTKIIITFEVLDNIIEFNKWLLMHTIPKRFELKRNE